MPPVWHGTTFSKKPNYIFAYNYSRFDHLLSSRNQDISQPSKLALYCSVIQQKGAPLQNCFGFVDGTVSRISSPKINQNIVYNSHKQVHGIKFQSLALPYRLIDNHSGTYEGKRHYSTMLHESALLTNLERSAWHNNQPLCIYGNPAYHLSIHLQAPFSRKNLTPIPVNYNKAMSQTQVSVEWLFNDIKNYFKFVLLKSQMKIGLSAVGKIYYAPYFL